ncbi:MAG: hypothetical protein K5774_02215 [Clostridia bacterium]|nr:hypothetical protein [Clostridia bacterium]
MADKKSCGKLTGCGWNSWRSGMMVDSYESTSLDLAETAPGVWQLTDEEKKGMKNRTVKIYRADTSAAQKIAALAEREDMPSWAALKEDTDPKYQPTDVSTGSTLNLVFDQSGSGGLSAARYDINVKAARQHGHADAVDEFIGLLKGCLKDDMLISEKKTGAGSGGGNPFGGLFSKKPGTRTCPECGCREVTGKFCPECGCKMP